MKNPIRLTHGSCVDLENDWRLHAVTEDKTLRGVFTINGHDYFGDGRPLTMGAPRIRAVAAK